MESKAKELKYGDVRNQIKDGDVLLHRGKTIVTLLIRLFTCSQYSHAGIAVWWNDRLMAMESIWPMVIINPLSQSVRRYKGGVDWFSCVNPIDHKRLDIIKSAQRELGHRFSLPKLILFLFKFLFRRKTTEEDRLKRYEKALICSEYVARVYKSVDLDLVKYKADRFTSPADIANSPLLEKMGTLKR
jgi:hypothetical protein